MILPLSVGICVHIRGRLSTMAGLLFSKVCGSWIMRSARKSALPVQISSPRQESARLCGVKCIGIAKGFGLNYSAHRKRAEPGVKMCFSSRMSGRHGLGKETMSGRHLLGKETISHISTLYLLGIMEFSTVVLRIWGASAFSSFYPGFLSLQPKLSRSASASSYLLLLATQRAGSFAQMCSDTGHLLEEMCGCRLLLLWPALSQGTHIPRQ